jgi:peptidoglycan/xylan/chitin deacetylase (PgdA/CDA1 family)
MAGTPIPILRYHTVSDRVRPGMETRTTHPDVFREHLDVLETVGATPLTVSEIGEALAHDLELPPGTVGLTFDGGFAEVLTHVAPLIYERGLAATLYVTTSTIGAEAEVIADDRHPELLGAPELRHLEQHGFEIGAHAHTHRTLGTLHEEALAREIEFPKQILERVLGHPIRTFAYRAGEASPSVRDATRRAGYRAAVGVRHGLAHPDDDRYDLARVIVTPGLTLDVLVGWLTGTDDEHGEPPIGLRETA